jgi:hypothetical protein
MCVCLCGPITCWSLEVQYGYTGSLAGLARGPAMGTKGVRRERWRSAGPAGAFAGKGKNRVPLLVQH